VLRRFEFQVGEAFHRTRLDQFLFKAFPSLSKMYLREIVREGGCEVNGYVVNSGWILRSNDFVEIEADPDRATAMRAEDIPLDIVFEDEHLIVVDKPAGLLVHPTHREKNGTLLNALAFHLNPALRDSMDVAPERPETMPVRPGLVHRLDKGTSGLIVATRSELALSVLTKHFRRRLVEKRYAAAVEGVLADDSGEIRAPIGRFEAEKYWGVKADGKPGITNFHVVDRLRGTTLIDLEPVTGRTNQLRIHCGHIGHPIVGDVRYGGRSFPRLCLHARSLRFRHPATNEPLSFESPVPWSGSEFCV
jgi:23S rRNA pseudouridine1911/1915/1917 synthase